MSATSRNTLVTLIGNGLTLVLGLGVVVGVGKKFGLGEEMDAFWVANTLPNIVGQIFLSLALLLLAPLFIRRCMEEGEEAAWEVGNTFLTGTVLAALAACVVLWLAAPTLIRLLAPGFEPRTAFLAGRLMRVLAISLPALALTGTISALLISHHRFVVSALARPVALACVLAGLWAGSKQLGVHAYAYAVVVGAVSAALLTSLSLFRYRRMIRPQWKWRSPAMVSLLSMLPVLVAARALDHGNQLITRGIASVLPAGSISSLGYAWTLFQVPGIVGASLGTVVYPQFSEKHALGHRKELVDQVVRCCRLLLLVSCPMGVLFLCLSQPITQLLFERGLFHHSDTVLTAGVVASYGIGVMATSINTLIGNLYWSMGLIWARIGLEAVGILLCALLGFILAHQIGPAGLGLATSMMYVGLVLGGLVFLRRRVLPLPQWAGLLPSLASTLGCGGVMGLAVLATKAVGVRISAAPLIVVASATAIGLATYLVACWKWRRQDVLSLGSSLKQLVIRSKLQNEPQTMRLQAAESTGIGGAGQ